MHNENVAHTHKQKLIQREWYKRNRSGIKRFLHLPDIKIGMNYFVPLNSSEKSVTNYIPSLK